MDWDNSQLAASAFAKGHGGMSLGQQWALAAMLREVGSASRGGRPKKTLEQILEEDRKRAEKLAKSGFRWDVTTIIK